MRKGKIQKVSWGRYATSKFSFPQEIDEDVECGSYALYCITKKSYGKINKLSKNGHWSTHTMLGFLKKHNYGIIPITMGSMVECHSVKVGKPGVTTQNVILIEQAAYREESTWAVLYGGKIAHSGDVSAIDALQFLNWPIEAAYLITHKNWR